MGMGDEIMAAGRAWALAQATGHAKIGILDAAGRPRWNGLWERCAWVARPHEMAGAAFRDGPNVRPYIAGKSANKWTWTDYKPTPCPFALTDEEIEWGRHEARDAILLCPHIKPAASPNKQWPLASWQALVHELRASNERRPIFQLRDSGARPMLSGVTASLMAPTEWHVAALLRECSIAVMQEGGLHHLSAGVASRAIIIAGGYISEMQTGYRIPSHTWLGAKKNGCGARIPCAHCAEAMRAIEPGAVARIVAGQEA